MKKDRERKEKAEQEEKNRLSEDRKSVKQQDMKISEENMPHLQFVQQTQHEGRVIHGEIHEAPQHVRLGEQSPQVLDGWRAVRLEDLCDQRAQVVGTGPDQLLARDQKVAHHPTGEGGALQPSASHGALCGKRRSSEMRCKVQ